MLETFQYGLVKLLMRNPEFLPHFERLSVVVEPVLALWREYESQQVESSAALGTRKPNSTSQ